MTSSLPPLAQAVSGALGSATANAISYPLDLAATKLQTTSSRSSRFRGFRGIFLVLKYVLRHEGLAGLYDGLGADTASTLISNFLYFYFYTLLHAIVARRRAAATNVPLLGTLKRALTSPTPPALLGIPTELAVGFFAGVASRAMSTPLSVVTVRLQTGGDDNEADDSSDEDGGEEAMSPNSKKPSRFSEVIHDIYSEQGLSGFWAGFQPTLPLCLTPAVTLLLFQFLSRLRLPGRRPGSSTQLRPSALSAFLSGATANALAVAILYPLLLAKVRVQAYHNGVGANSVTDVWSRAIKEEGWRGLYQGLVAQLVKGFVNQGVTMLVKQRIERAAVRVYSRTR